MPGMSETTHRVEYLLPGALFPEETVHKITRRDPVLAAKKAPKSAFCFTFYDVAEAPDLGPEFTVIPKAQNKSGRYYIGGDIFTLAEVEAMPDAHPTLLSNMRGNGWDRVIRCRTGNWQPFTDEDEQVT